MLHNKEFDNHVSMIDIGYNLNRSKTWIVSTFFKDRNRAKVTNVTMRHIPSGRVWRRQSGKKIRKFECHQDMINFISAQNIAEIRRRRANGQTLL